MPSSFSKPSNFLSPSPHNPCVLCLPQFSLMLQSPSSSFPISFLISFDHPSSFLLLPLLASQLIGKDTGLGWDGEKKTIAASDEWWETKIQEDLEVAKFREQGLKFLPEMEFLFKGTIATSFAAYAPSEDSRQYEGFNTRTEETNDNIDDNIDMEVNEPEIDTTTQNMSSAKESGQRKRGREGDKRIGVAAKLSSQLDCIIQTFESSAFAQDPTSITTCVAKLKDLPGLERGSELFYKATRLMKKRANRITFVALEEPELQLGWIKSDT
ncbi:hypothetical protein AAZX31_18G105300 [Glycine max]